VALKICYAIDKLEECNKNHILMKNRRTSAKFLSGFPDSRNCPIPLTALLVSVKKISSNVHFFKMGNILSLEGLFKWCQIGFAISRIFHFPENGKREKP